MKQLFIVALAISLLSGSAAMAQQNFQGGNHKTSADKASNDQGVKAKVSNNRSHPTQSRNIKANNNRSVPDQARNVAASNNQGSNGSDRYEEYRNNPGVRMSSPRFSRGDRLPAQYSQDQRYVVNDWQSRNLRRPPRGYHWVRDDNNNYFLTAVTTGLILDLMLNSR